MTAPAWISPEGTSFSGAEGAAGDPGIQTEGNDETVHGKRILSGILAICFLISACAAAAGDVYYASVVINGVRYRLANPSLYDKPSQVKKQAENLYAALEAYPQVKTYVYLANSSRCVDVVRDVSAVPPAYESIQENAFGYLLKNESDDRVLELVRKALEKIRSRRKFETFFPQSGSWTESEGPRPKRITGQVKEYVLEHMGDDLSAGAIAEIVGYSEAHLSRLFRESEGITLHSFIQQVRMDRACHLLRDTNEKIYRIGEVCGYRNTAYFIRVFRSAMGITPQEFRDGKDK